MLPTPTEALILPFPLLLLVHLYILHYPHANDAEYDNDIFNPRVRGLRERTKSLEDIAYFLVGRIEGKGLKTILPVYPCRQPSESLSFRSSLAKYLDQLRHNAIYPSRISGGSARGNDSGNVVASWWKDAVVRKSLLEECTGEKFERLLLSLSTHTLMKSSKPIPQEMMSILLLSQPALYARALVRYESVRHSWRRSASFLRRWESDLELLRRLKDRTEVGSSSKYDEMSTGRLKALADSKLQELMNVYWPGQEAVLLTFIDNLGFSIGPMVSPKVAPDSLSLVNPSPLPVAAAYHPSYLKKLRRPIFQRPELDAEIQAPSRNRAEVVFTTQTEAEKRMQQVLINSLSHSKKRHNELKQAPSPCYLPFLSEDTVEGLWGFLPTTFNVTYDPEPTRELLVAIGLVKDVHILHPHTEGDNELERRVNEIRGGVLPPYPLVSDVSTPRLSSPAPAITASRTSQTRTRSDVHANRSVDSALNSRTSRDISKKVVQSFKRTSVRFSTARRRTGRLSMFGAFNDLDEEIDRLIDQTHDFPTDDDDSDHERPLNWSPNKTPKASRKTTPAPRTKPVEARTPQARTSEDFMLFEDEPPVICLPSLVSSTSSLFDDGSAKGCTSVEEVWAAPTPQNDGRIWRESVDAVEEDSFDDEGPSMTIKELLLSVDTSQHMLLQGEGDQMDSSFLKDDLSFAWE